MVAISDRLGYAGGKAMIKHIHSSGKNDRSLASVKKALSLYATAANLITLTEQQHRDSVDLWMPGWEVVKQTGPGAGDPAVLIRSDDWEVERVWVDKLSDKEQRRGPGGPPPAHALTVLLGHRKTRKTLIVSVAHLPSHVQGDWRDNAYRVKLWRECVKGWRSKVEPRRKRYGAKIAYIADWNLDIKKAWVRAVLRGYFPGLKLTWKKPFPNDGTHHKRIIDATLTNLRVKRKAVLVRDDDSSDHRPYQDVLDF